MGFDLDLVSQEITLDALLDTLGVDVGGLVEAQLEELLPSVYTFCDAETYQGECDAGLREILGADDGKSLDEVLDRAHEGFTYTEADLVEDLDEDLLLWIRHGFTETDLRDLILESTTAEVDLGEEATFTFALFEDFEDFDRIRGWIRLGRSLSFLPFVALGLVLAAIGALGGRSWPGRIGWASVVLGIASLLIYATFSSVYDSVLGTIINDEFDKTREDVREDEELGDASMFEVIMVDKSLSIASTFINDFVSGIASRALVLLIVALAGLGVVIFWPWIFWRSQPALALADGPPAEAPPAWGAADEPTVEVILEEPPYEDTPDEPVLDQSAPD